LKSGAKRQAQEQLRGAVPRAAEPQVPQHRPAELPEDNRAVAQRQEERRLAVPQVAPPRQREQLEGNRRAVEQRLVEPQAQELPPHPQLELEDNPPVAEQQPAVLREVEARAAGLPAPHRPAEQRTLNRDVMQLREPDPQVAGQEEQPEASRRTVGQGWGPANHQRRGSNSSTRTLRSEARTNFP
jgi:hypothetical protein